MAVRRTLRRWKDEGRFPVVLKAAEAARDAVIRPLQRPLVPMVARQLRETGAIESLDELLTRASTGYLRTIVPLQRRSEIIGLLEAVRALRPKRVLEIGTANGGTLFLFTRVAAEDARILSVDLPSGAFGGEANEWKHPLWEAFVTGRQTLRLIRADSHAPSTFETVKQDLGGEPIDFLMIDGDHTYDGVKQDFATYAPLVRPGGIIAFHDICKEPHGGGGEVHRFWSEVREGRNYVELRERPDEGFGIGFIRA
jgi:predicted O-methyltransferase YrrM